MIRDYYDDLYREADHIFGRLPSPLSLRTLSFCRQGTVLDIGCGQGPDALYFAQKGLTVVAVDFSLEAISALDRVKEELPITAIVADITDGAFAGQLPSHIDIVFSRWTLQLLAPQQRSALLQQLQERYPSAIHAHIIPVTSVCFGEQFVVGERDVDDLFADMQVLHREVCDVISRRPNANGEHYLVREARIIARFVQ